MELDGFIHRQPDWNEGGHLKNLQCIVGPPCDFPMEGLNEQVQDGVLRGGLAAEWAHVDLLTGMRKLVEGERVRYGLFPEQAAVLNERVVHDTGRKLHDIGEGVGVLIPLLGRLVRLHSLLEARKGSKFVV